MGQAMPSNLSVHCSRNPHCPITRFRLVFGASKAPVPSPAAETCWLARCPRRSARQKATSCTLPAPVTSAAWRLRLTEARAVVRLCRRAPSFFLRQPWLAHHGCGARRRGRGVAPAARERGSLEDPLRLQWSLACTECFVPLAAAGSHPCVPAHASRLSRRMPHACHCSRLTLLAARASASRRSFAASMAAARCWTAEMPSQRCTTRKAAPSIIPS